mmetsp:Transcript_46846/g.52385  ORF Transcript_46846/g.52385 Transcript_46846/m.52385 type:complete len:85 (+) Transcript_46846:2-256(+)
MSFFLLKRSIVEQLNSGFTCTQTIVTTHTHSDFHSLLSCGDGDGDGDGGGWTATGCILCLFLFGLDQGKKFDRCPYELYTVSCL